MKDIHAPFDAAARHVCPQMLTRTLLFVLLLCAFPMRHAAASRANALAPMSPGNVMVGADDEYGEAKIRLVSYGAETATTVTYSLYYTDTQETEGPVTVTLDTPIEADGTGEITIKLKPGKTLAKADVILTLSHVNGQYNEISVNYAYITRYTVTAVPRKRAVIEDYTGMWCQYCPRGIAIMESLQRLFPDDFIGIAIHVGEADKLETHAYEYETQSKWATTYPTLWCNRSNKVYTFDGLSELANELTVPALMDVDVTATLDEAADAISVTAGVTPCMEAEDKYALAYVLTEDGMHDDKWYQANRPGEWDDVPNAPDELVAFRKYGAVIPGTDIDFNHVAIAAQGIGAGIAGSLSGGYTPGERKTHATSFTGIASNRFIQDRSKLSVCALLIDTSTGRIENAAKCAVTSKTTGLCATPHAAPRAAAPTVWYSPDGRRTGAHGKGVRIGVTPDGRTVKTISNR